MTEAPRTIVRDYRIAEGDIAALRQLIGRKAEVLHCRNLAATIDSPVLQSKVVAFDLDSTKVWPPEWIEIEPRVVADEPDCPNAFAIPKAFRTGDPKCFPVTADEATGHRLLHPHSYVYLTGWGDIESVEIVSFTQIHDDAVDEHGTFTQVIRFDRALKLRFSGGRTMSLSTPMPSDTFHPIIEIRPSDDIGPLWADQSIATRITLN
jgi:hypothetical protein